MQVTGRDNNMKIGFESMPGIAEALLENLSEKKLSEAVPDELVQGLERVVVTGCGDSYAATLATKELNERMFAGCDYHALRTIDVSRHFVFPQRAPEKTLVMVISVSGGGARVTEAMMRAAKAGCTTLGITAHPESRMGVQAQYILQLKIPQLPVSSIASQTRNYLAALMTTLLMGLHAGRVRGVISERQVEERRAEVLRYVRAVCDPGVLDRVDDQMMRLASAGWKDYLGYDFVGAGSDFATAYFGTAKFFEYYGALSCLNDSEDWCHINYFMRDRGRIGSIVVASQNSASFSRSVETIASMQKSGRNVLVVTDAAPEAFIEGVTVCRLPGTDYAYISPLMNYIPLCMLGNYIALLNNYEYFGGMGPENPLFSQEGGINTIKSSKIVLID